MVWCSSLGRKKLQGQRLCLYLGYGDWLVKTPDLYVTIILSQLWSSIDVYSQIRTEQWRWFRRAGRVRQLRRLQAFP